MKKRIISFIISIIPIAYFLVYSSNMADTVIIHWDAQGIADQYGSKYFYLGFAFVPLLITSLNIILKKFYKSSRNEKIANKFIIVLVVFFSALSIMLTRASGSEEITFIKPLLILFSIIFIGFGNICNKLEKNYIFGIRIKYTLQSDRVWNRVHYVGGYIFVALGIITFLTAIVFTNPINGLYVMIATLLPAIIFILLYARKLYINEQNESKH